MSWKLLKSVPLALFAGGLLAAVPVAVDAPFSMQTAAAQEDDKPKRKTRRTPTMRLSVNKDIEEAQVLYEEKDIAGALEILNDLKEDDLNEYEFAVLYNFLGAISYEQEDIEGAIRNYEKILSFGEKVPLSLEIGATYALAQLNFVKEDYREAIKYLNLWFENAENPGPQPYVFLGQAYFQLEEYEESIPYMQKAIQIAQEKALEVKENWWLILRGAYFELNNYEKVREILEILVVNYSKPQYWLQLGAVYAELGQEKRQLAVMEVAYKQGYLERESHFVNMAQLYMYHSVPIKAAWVLEKGMEDGVVERDGDNLKLLGQALLNAQELEKSLEPLTKAAEMRDDGDDWLRLGQVNVELENWDRAIEALTNAVGSGDLDESAEGNAELLIGMAHFNQEDFEDARKSFRAANRFDSTKKSAGQWLQYLNKELERRSALSAYYGEQN